MPVAPLARSENPNQPWEHDFGLSLIPIHLLKRNLFFTRDTVFDLTNSYNNSFIHSIRAFLLANR